MKTVLIVALYTSNKLFQYYITYFDDPRPGVPTISAMLYSSSAMRNGSIDSISVSVAANHSEVSWQV